MASSIPIEYKWFLNRSIRPFNGKGMNPIILPPAMGK